MCMVKYCTPPDSIELEVGDIVMIRWPDGTEKSGQVESLMGWPKSYPNSCMIKDVGPISRKWIVSKIC